MTPTHKLIRPVHLFNVPFLFVYILLSIYVAMLNVEGELLTQQLAILEQRIWSEKLMIMLAVIVGVTSSGSYLLMRSHLSDPLAIKVSMALSFVMIGLSIFLYDYDASQLEMFQMVDEYFRSHPDVINNL